jgi:hypothetical protein
MDLQANSESIADVVEASTWPEMIALLEAINSPISAYRSLGREKSFSIWNDTEQPHLKVKLDSYFEVAIDNIELNARPAQFEEMMGEYAEFAQGRHFDCFTIFAPELTRTSFTKHNINAWCLSIWIGGFGENEAAARAAWTTVVSALTAFFSSGWVPSPIVDADTPL